MGMSNLCKISCVRCLDIADSVPELIRQGKWMDITAQAC